MYKIKEVKTEADILLVVSTAEEIWNQHFVPIIGKAQVDYMLEKFQSFNAISEVIADGYKYYMIFEDDMPVGYTGIHVEENGRMFLSKLYIKEEFRGRGLSRMLLENAVNKNSPVKSVYLTVNKHNDNTIAVYKHMGFEIIDSVVSDIGNGFVMDDYIMEIKLN